MAARLGRFVLDTAEERARSVGSSFTICSSGRRLLRSPEHGVAVRHSLGTRYPRLLLDEFQDTDPIQIELAVLIAADPTIDITGKAWHEIETRPGSLFLVGDPKQSIYRFRRADIGTFLTAREHISDRPALTVNFRTTKPIITWINKVLANSSSPSREARPSMSPCRHIARSRHLSVRPSPCSAPRPTRRSSALTNCAP